MRRGGIAMNSCGAPSYLFLERTVRQAAKQERILTKCSHPAATKQEHGVPPQSWLDWVLRGLPEQSGGNAVEAFLSKHANDVIGVLSGFDRLVFRGTLRMLAHHLRMQRYLWAMPQSRTPPRSAN
jgi:hypothetical protein